MLRRVFSTLTKSNSHLSLKIQPLFFFSSRRNFNGDNNNNDDFEFDFGRPNEQAPKTDYKHMRYDNTNSTQQRYNPNIHRGPSEILNSTSILELTKLIEEGKSIHVRSESVKLINLTLSLLRKGQPWMLNQFKRSKAAESLYNEMYNTLMDQDKPYISAILYHFYGIIKNLPGGGMSWNFDKTTISALYANVEQAIKDDTLTESDLLKVLQSAILMSSNIGGSAYRKLSTGILSIEGTLNFNQINGLVYLIKNFDFSYDYVNWVKKLEQNHDALSSDITNNLINILIDLKQVSASRKEIRNTIKHIENILMERLGTDEQKNKTAILRILSAIPTNQLRNLREFLHSKVVKIAKETPENFTGFDISKIALYITNNADSSLVNELVDALAEVSNKKQNLFVDKVGGLEDGEIINACRLHRNIANIKKAFHTPIIENINNSLKRSKSLRASLLFFLDAEDMQQILQTVAANKSNLRDFDLCSILLVAHLKNVEIPQELTEQLDKALNNNAVINSIMPKALFTNYEAGKAIITKTLETNTSSRFKVDVAYLSPELAPALIGPLVENKQLSRIFDNNPDMPINGEMFKYFLEELSASIKTAPSLTTLLRLNRLLNKNAFVLNYKNQSPLKFVRQVSDAANSYLQDQDENLKNYGNQSFINILSATLDDSILGYYHIQSVKYFINQILDLSIETTRMFNFDLIRRLNDLLFNVDEKINTAYINLLMAEIPIKKQYVDRIIDHAFIAQESYVSNGKLNALDEIYNTVFESTDVTNLNHVRLVTLLKVLNKTDAELLDKLNSIDLKKYVNDDSIIDFFMITLQRYILTKDSTLLTKVAAIGNETENIKIFHSQMLRLFAIINKNDKLLTENETVKQMCDKLVNKYNITGYIRGYKKGFEPLINYMIKVDKPLDDLMNDPKANARIKGKIFEMLVSFDKQPELRNRLLKENPAECINALSNSLSLLIEKVIIASGNQEISELVYEKLPSLDFKRFEVKVPSNKYALLWISINKPDIFAQIINKLDNKLRPVQQQNFDATFLNNVLTAIGYEVSNETSFNDIRAAELIYGDNIIISDIFKNEIKNQVLNTLFPGKNIVELKFKDLRNGTSVDKIQDVLKNAGVITDDFTAEHRLKIDEIVNTRQQNIDKAKQNKEDAALKLKQSTLASENDISSDEISSSDLEFEIQHK